MKGEVCKYVGSCCHTHFTNGETEFKHLWSQRVCLHMMLKQPKILLMLCRRPSTPSKPGTFRDLNIFPASKWITVQLRWDLEVKVIKSDSF